ncbi:hypothetical protein [Brevundimonas sp.]|uniref:hypothetical protein n=1 Tax=Brevundimonas sp. TaxID=1871086 RepID=UPI0035B4D186
MGDVLSWQQIGSAGAFTTSQVARLIHRDPSEVLRWTKGEPPLIASDYEPIQNRPILSFEALLEARFVSHMLREGVPMRLLRKVSDKLKGQGITHPLAAEREIVSDGFRLFESSDGRLINLVNECYAEPDLMKPALEGRVRFKRGVALYFEPYPRDLPLVRIDPRLAFGRPVVVDGDAATPTAKLASVAESEGVEAAADWYLISADAVRQAAEFEQRLAA